MKVNDDREVVYLKHPLEYKDKMYWVGKGCKINDLKFAPDGYKNPDQIEAAEEKPKAKRKPRASKT